jgi:membrane-bound metal-dependent hydrolase YbcI (DUF457 family)
MGIAFVARLRLEEDRQDCNDCFSMPTPVGHALAGLATGWFAAAIMKKKDGPLTMACMAAAVAPDLDIPFGIHRTYTHSIGAACAAGAVAWLIARRRSHRPVAVAFTVVVAYSTHLLLDWLAKDSAEPYGLTVLWPFSSRFYISGVNLFLEVSRRYWKPEEFILGNLKAATWESIVLAPVLALAWWMRQRRFAKAGADTSHR